MDKILAFSILSSSPADISATGGFSTGLSWWRRMRTSSSAGTQKEKKKQQQAEKEEEEGLPAGSRPAERKQKQARFAPEFDGINCFESIVSF
jgi:hypothetical protein